MGWTQNEEQFVVTVAMHDDCNREAFDAAVERLKENLELSAAEANVEGAIRVSVC